MALQQPRVEPGTVQDRLTTYVREQMERILELSGPALAAGDEESIHKLRVAVRRGRSAFRSFAPHFRKKTRTQAGRTLRKLGRLLASVRDLDALRERLESDALASLRVTDSDAVHVLSDRLADERERRATALPAMVCYADLARAKHSVDRALERLKPGFTDPVEESRAQVIRSLCAIDPLLQKARDPADTEAHHRLRIEAKRVRYALEVLEPLLAGKVEAAISVAREVQDALGLLQDATVLRELCQEFAPDFPSLREHLEEVRLRAHAEMLESQGLDRGLEVMLRALAEEPSEARVAPVNVEMDA